GGDGRPVAVRVRPDGTRRYLDPGLAASSPTPEGAAGVRLPAAALQLLPAAETVPEADGLERLVRRPRRQATVLLGGGLVGREALLGELAASARAAFAGAPTVGRACGEAGLGKTHLRREPAARLAGDADVIELRAHDPTEGHADPAVRER